LKHFAEKIAKYTMRIKTKVGDNNEPYSSLLVTPEMSIHSSNGSFDITLWEM